MWPLHERTSGLGAIDLSKYKMQYFAGEHLLAPTAAEASGTGPRAKAVVGVTD